MAPRLTENGYLPVYLRPRGLLDGHRDPIAEAIREVKTAADAAKLEATADFNAPSLWELFKSSTTTPVPRRVCVPCWMPSPSWWKTACRSA